MHVDWTVRWSSPDSGGTFDALPDNLTTYTFPRQVDEVQSIVTGADLG